MDNENKEVKIKKKIKIKSILLVLLLLYILGFICYKIIMLPIRNIYIANNNYLTDQEIIDIAGIDNYPSFILTTRASIKSKLLKNPLIKEVKISKKFKNKLYIEVIENTPLFYDSVNNRVVLSNSKYIDTNIFVVPILSNEMDENIYTKLIEKYNIIDEEIRLLISEIKYVPNDIDKERFIFTMNDGNSVYITLYKTYLINDYIKILSTLEGNKGILYLDSGNYFEIYK